MRNFYWSTNNLWLSELLRLDTKHTIVLSELDEYIPTAEIKEHVGEINDRAAREGKEHPVELFICENLGHGDFLACQKTFPQIYELIAGFNKKTL